MDEINIEGLRLTALDQIFHPDGDIFHGMKKKDPGYSGLGEAYFSTINTGSVKGWKKHKKMTLNLVVISGSVKFIIYDDRDNSNSKENFFKVELSLSNFKRLTVPPGLWLAFKGVSNKKNIILNIADIEHDTQEIEKLDLGKINFNWDSI